MDKNGFALSITAEDIKDKIYTIRGVQVMLDRDIAKLYSVETRVLNQAVSRNSERFPDEYCFQLTGKEFNEWKSQVVMSNADKMGLRRPPFCLMVSKIFLLFRSPKKNTYLQGAQMEP